MNLRRIRTTITLSAKDAAFVRRVAKQQTDDGERPNMSRTLRKLVKRQMQEEKGEALERKR